jgi:hypothetical protein
MLDTLGLPGLSDQLGHKFHVHARRFPIESLPEKDEGLAKWLEERWVEKREWLEAQRLSWASGESTWTPFQPTHLPCVWIACIGVCEQLRYSPTIYPRFLQHAASN